MGQEKVCDKYCLTCIYFQGGADSACMCHYLLITGERRNCDPGKGCTKKIRRKNKRKLQVRLK